MKDRALVRLQSEAVSDQRRTRIGGIRRMEILHALDVIIRIICGRPYPGDRLSGANDISLKHAAVPS